MLGGIVVRVPVEEGLLTGLTVVLNREAAAGETDEAFDAAAAGTLHGILSAPPGGRASPPAVSSRPKRTRRAS